MSNRKFFHFGNHTTKKDEPIIIHLENTVFDPKVVIELVNIIRKALNDGTWERTTIVPVLPMSINLSTGKGEPMDREVSDNILNSLITAILLELRGNGNE